MTEELTERIEEIKTNLQVEKTALSSAVRSKTSAPDDRPSAAGVGYLGTAILVLVFGGIFLIDIVSAVRAFTDK